MTRPATRLELNQKPNREVLARITENDVLLWLAAKLDLMREETKLPIYHMTAEVWRREYPDQPYDMSWSMHAPDVCALTHRTIESAITEVREELGDPAQKADELRRKAKHLIEEATELEACAAARSNDRTEPRHERR